jgi:hypothetical protein
MKKITPKSIYMRGEKQKKVKKRIPEDEQFRKYLAESTF